MKEETKYTITFIEHVNDWHRVEMGGNKGVHCICISPTNM